MPSLAVKYRPKTLEEVVSQDSIIKILKRQLELGEIKNTYLFCGASGCGKTTIARAFANAINNGKGSPIEIDAASNNGVDNVRSIVASSSERSLDSEYKVIIVDECHALSSSSWQAFLKCIEEPPRYTIFIFATTDPQKIPSTILNRVMRFNFTRIPANKIKDRLMYISQKEGFSNYAESCEYISRICNGQMRDAISLLEKCASYDSNISINNTVTVLGNFSNDIYFKLINNIIDGNIEKSLNIINDVYLSGADLKLFIDNFLTFGLDVAKYCLCKDISVTKFPSTAENDLNACTNFDNSQGYYVYVVDKLLELKNIIKTDLDCRSTVEVYIIKMCNCR